MKKVILYTDGACSGNPGAGGWAAILKYKDVEKELFGAEPDTTNNRMELMAVIEGLSKLTLPCHVDVYSDSAYVVNAVLNDWLNQWVLNGWKTASNKPCKNVDLWERLLEKLDYHDVEFHKVAGHSDDIMNNRCDKLAVAAYKALMNT